jgi:hypothetical protein
LLRALIYRALRRLTSLSDLLQALRENPALLEALGLDPLGDIPSLERFSDWLRFADPKVQSLCHALLAFPQLPGGFSNRHLRERFAALLGKPATALTAGRMTYHLRRLRLHQLIERIPGTHRYRLTDFGLRTALFFTPIYNHLLRPGLGRTVPEFSKLSCPLRRAFDKLDQEVKTWVQHAQLSAA